MADQLTIRGVKEVTRDLSRLGVEAGDLKDTMQRVGTIVADEVRELVPTRTGRLARSVRASRTKSRAIIRAGSARVPYAGVQNYGGYHGIEGHHFMEDGLEAKQPAAMTEFDKGMRELIHKYGFDI